MKFLVVVLVLLLIGIGALGFYQGWFVLSSDKTDHNSNVTLTVDKDKFQEDKEMAKEKVQDLGKNVKDKTSDKTDKVKD